MVVSVGLVMSAMPQLPDVFCMLRGAAAGIASRYVKPNNGVKSVQCRQPCASLRAGRDIKKRGPHERPLTSSLDSLATDRIAHRGLRS